MNKIQEIENIFSIFHDGYIDTFKIESNRIDLKISMQYLAELINDKYEFLNLSLHGVTSLSYDAWADQPFIMTDWNKILELGIVILNAETDNSGQIIIHSNCDNAPNDSFQGGKLVVKCLDYSLTDEENNRLTIEKLKELSTYYWNEKFAK